MPNLNFLSKLNPFAGYRDPVQTGLQKANVFGQGGPLMGGPSQYPEQETGPMQPRMLPGLQKQFVPPNPNLTAPPEPKQPSAIDQYRTALGQQPMRKDYSPSKKRTFGGIMLGGLAGTVANNPMVGYSMARDITGAPYEHAMEDWKTTTSGYKNLADIEENQNTLEENRRFREAQLTDLSTNRRRIDEDRDASRAITQQNADNTTRRTNIAEALAGGNKLFQDVNGNVWRVPRTGGEAVLDPKLKGLSFEDRLMLENAGRLVLQDDRQFFAENEANKAREATRVENEKKANAKLSGDQTVTTTEQEPNASEKIKQAQLAAAEFARRHPDKADWISEDDAGMPIMKAGGRPYWMPGASTKDADDKLIEEFNKAIRGAFENRTTTRTTVKGTGQPGTTTPAKETAKETETTGAMTTGTPPPIEQRKVGQKHKFNNGKIGVWNGKSYIQQ